MKRCFECGLDETEVGFTKSREYICKNCVKNRNQQYTLKAGKELRFIPKVTDTHKQCCMCKEMKSLNKYSNSPRGRKGKSSYCKPCASEYQLKYLSKEERRKKTQKYRDNNREWWRSLHRINQFNRKNKIKLYSDGTVTPEIINSLYNEEICYYCDQYIYKEFRTIDHKQPLNKEGKHTIDNLTMACLYCNSSKRDMTEKEFFIYMENNSV